MIPNEITALINLIGAPAVFVLLLALRDWFQGKSSSKQENAITDLALDSNAERRERQAVIDKLQESNNHLQNEVFEIRLEQAKEAGRREEMRITNDKNEAKIVTLEVRLQELEKYQQASKERISELEAEIIILNKRIVELNGEISLLVAQKRELESQLEKETNRANSLNDLVTRLQAPTPSVTQPIPTMQDVDETVITEPNPVTPVTPETTVTNADDDAA